MDKKMYRYCSKGGKMYQDCVVSLPANGQEERDWLVTYKSWNGYESFLAERVVVAASAFEAGRKVAEPQFVVSAVRKE